MSRCLASASSSVHSDMFMCARPFFTSRAISHEPGASLAYQGQRVSLVWQSKQAFCSTASTSGGAFTA